MIILGKCFSFSRGDWAAEWSAGNTVKTAARNKQIVTAPKAEHGHSCPQQCPICCSLGKSGGVEQTGLLRTGMSALRFVGGVTRPQSDKITHDDVPDCSMEHQRKRVAGY